MFTSITNVKTYALLIAMRFGFCLQGLPAGALRRCAPARHRVHGVRDVDAGYQAPCGVDQRTLQATQSLSKNFRRLQHVEELAGQTRSL